MAKLCTGIEIAPDSLRLALLSDKAVLSAVCEPLPSVFASAGDVPKPSGELGSFIRETALRAGITCRRCALVIPDGVCFTRRFTLPAIPQSSVKMNLAYEFRDFALGEGEYIYDYAVLGRSAGPNGSELMELHAAAVRRSYMDECRSMLGAAGFRLNIAVPREFACANLLRRLGKADGLQCMVDIRRQSAQILIYCGASFEASRLVEFPDGALEGEDSDRVCRSIAFDTAMTINYFASEPNRRPDTVYVCGSGECVQRISEAMVGMREPGDHEFGVLPATDLMPPCRSGGAGDGFEAHCAAAAGAAVQTWVRKESKACRERRERKERKERRT